jgi:MEMO1 family protein
MTHNAKLPALRPIQITPFRDEAGNLFFDLRDLTQISPRPLVLSGGGYFVLVHLDGAHTVQDVQAAFRREIGQEIDPGEVLRVVAALDQYAMLDTPRFAAAYAAQREAYRSAQCRDNRDHWPAGELVRAEIEKMLAGTSSEAVPNLRGVIAPHLDYPRGAPCYAAAYATLAQSPPAERYVILGTNHYGAESCAVGTTKDFQTPLGLVRTDRAFISRLEDRLGTGICEHEFAHRGEHSVELQVHVLQVCLGDHHFEIVPIICADLPGDAATTPGDGHGPDLAAFADALRGCINDDPRRTLVIAGADLSHIGQHFGDEHPSTPAILADVEQRDRGLLAMLEAGDAEGFAASVRASGNPTRVCSAAGIYILRQALAEYPLRVLCYHQAIDSDTDTNVTCAAAVVG